MAAAAVSRIKDAGFNNILLATSAWEVFCQTDDSLSDRDDVS